MRQTTQRHPSEVPHSAEPLCVPPYDYTAMERATLKDLRQAAQQTQEQLAAALGVGQDTISRLEKRSDMLLSTLCHYVESMGGTLELVVQFPNRPPVVIEHLWVEATPRRKSSNKTRNTHDMA